MYFNTCIKDMLKLFSSLTAACSFQEWSEHREYIQFADEAAHKNVSDREFY